MANLSCVDAQIGDVQRCVSENTHFYVEKFNKFNSGEMPGVSQENVTLPPIYACIISVATASCFHKALALAPGCSIPQRKLMYDYYTMMSGNCRTIAGVVDETPTTQESTTQETLGTNQRSVETRNQAETIQQQTTSDVTRGGKRRGGNLFETDVTRQRAEVASAGAGNATTTQMIGRLEMGRNATVESPRSECPVFRAKLLLVFAVMVASVLCVL
ncbi:hypothetical protein DPMN_012928 [Dreissena polymorpha]|uniref:Uncharacterized protein n=2 Tax=Dreissena polymorpha TaxID=45954 RepID=A0A9D4S370_DREPO|nr:hypothetical protein DPMN_012928 [Dreissena polymorpha]